MESVAHSLSFSFHFRELNILEDPTLRPCMPKGLRRFHARNYPYSVCWLTFNNTPTLASITNKLDPP